MKVWCPCFYWDNTLHAYPKCRLVSYVLNENNPPSCTSNGNKCFVLAYIRSGIPLKEPSMCTKASERENFGKMRTFQERIFSEVFFKLWFRNDNRNEVRYPLKATYYLG